MSIKQITLNACLISLLGGCATTSPVNPIGQCNPGAPVAQIDLPNGWARNGIARQAEALGLNEDEKRALDARWLEGDRVEAEAVAPPRVRYPNRARNKNLQGECLVFFVIGVDGKAVAAEPYCSDPVFEGSAVEAISEGEFRPVIVDGDVKVRFGVFQPLVYCLK